MLKTDTLLLTHGETRKEINVHSFAHAHTTAPCSRPWHASTSHRKEWEGGQNASIRRTLGMILLVQEQQDKCTHMHVVPWSCHMHGCVHGALSLAGSPDARIQQPTRGHADSEDAGSVARMCVCVQNREGIRHGKGLRCVWERGVHTQIVTARAHRADMVMFSAES